MSLSHEAADARVLQEFCQGPARVLPSGCALDACPSAQLADALSHVANRAVAEDVNCRHLYTQRFPVGIVQELVHKTGYQPFVLP